MHAARAAEHPLVTLRYRIVDEKDKGVTGARVWAGGFSPNADQSYSEVKDLSGRDGSGNVKFEALMDVYLSADKPGAFYKSKSRDGNQEQFDFEPLDYRKDVPEREQKNPPLKKEVSLEGSLVLREVRNPIPLHAKHVRVDFPARDVWLGYDLEVGDWTPPHGEGGRADIRFRSSPKRKEEGKSLSESAGTAVLEIDLGDGGGFVRVTEDNGYLPVSEMKMPHEAPEDGYGELPVLRFEQEGYKRQNKLGGYFFRTRVVRRDGEMVRANYGKIIEDFSYYPVERDDPRFRSDGKNDEVKPIFGGVEFTYYFNPEPNDRNLEFNPEKNLFNVNGLRGPEYLIEEP